MLELCKVDKTFDSGIDNGLGDDYRMRFFPRMSWSLSAMLRTWELNIMIIVHILIFLI